MKIYTKDFESNRVIDWKLWQDFVTESTWKMFHVSWILIYSYVDLAVECGVIEKRIRSGFSWDHRLVNTKIFYFCKRYLVAHKFLIEWDFFFVLLFNFALIFKKLGNFSIMNIHVYLILYTLLLTKLLLVRILESFTEGFITIFVT